MQKYLASSLWEDLSVNNLNSLILSYATKFGDSSQEKLSEQERLDVCLQVANSKEIMAYINFITKLAITARICQSNYATQLPSILDNFSKFPILPADFTKYIRWLVRIAENHPFEVKSATKQQIDQIFANFYQSILFPVKTKDRQYNGIIWLTVIKGNNPIDNSQGLILAFYALAGFFNIETDKSLTSYNMTEEEQSCLFARYPVLAKRLNEFKIEIDKSLISLKMTEDEKLCLLIRYPGLVKILQTLKLDPALAARFESLVTRFNSLQASGELKAVYTQTLTQSKLMQSPWNKGLAEAVLQLPSAINPYDNNNGNSSTASPDTTSTSCSTQAVSTATSSLSGVLQQQRLSFMPPPTNNTPSTSKKPDSQQHLPCMLQ